MTFDEKYTATTSKFWLHMGRAGKELADAFSQADLENQAAIKDLVFEAMSHRLVEAFGWTREEIAGRAPVHLERAYLAGANAQDQVSKALRGLGEEQVRAALAKATDPDRLNKMGRG